MSNTATRSNGLRKFIPQPDRYRERYGNFTLTTRDMEILETVYGYRFLEARHVSALVGGSAQQVVRRLQGLFHNGYLGRYARRERMRLELDPGAPLIAYGLELKGARALERQRAATAATANTEPNPVRWKKEYTRRMELFLEHQLMVSGFRCVLELAIRRTSDMELVTWKQGKETWFPVAIPGERKRVTTIAPDAYFVVRRGSRVHHFYLEADRGTEEHRRLLEKFVGYWAHVQMPPFVEPGSNRPRLSVLVVSTGARRMRAMMDTLARMHKPNRAEHGGKGMFRFATEVSYCTDSPAAIFDPIWSLVGDRIVGLLD